MSRITPDDVVQCFDVFEKRIDTLCNSIQELFAKTQHNYTKMYPLLKIDTPEKLMKFFIDANIVSHKIDYLDKTSNEVKRQDNLRRDLYLEIESIKRQYDNLNEFIKDNKQKQDDLKPFDDIAFADQRYNTEPEENNDFENFVFKDMRTFVLNSNYALDDVTVDALSKTLEDETYDDIIHQPSKFETLYRGFVKDADWIEKLLTVKQLLTVEQDDYTEFELDNKYYKTRYGRTSSWTTDYDVATRFTSTQPTSSHEYQIILVARVSENKDVFIEGPRGFYRVNGLDANEDEQESIALKPVKLHSTLVKRAEDDY